MSHPDGRVPKHNVFTFFLNTGIFLLVQREVNLKKWLLEILDIYWSILIITA